MLQRIRDAKFRTLSMKNLKEMRDEGFTLIELLIVIVVLGVLAGIVVFGVSTFKSDSETAACNATKKTAEVAAEAYNAKNGSYTNDLTVLKNQGYLKSVPVGVTLLNGVASGTCQPPAAPAAG